MSTVLNILLLVDLCLTFVCVYGLVKRWRTVVFARGRHVTRPLRRKLGNGGTRLVRLLLIVSVYVSLFAGLRLPGRVLLLVFWLWLIDDVYFGDDDERRKRWEGARVKLRKWKPVMRRLVQQWKPHAPRTPVPA